MFINILAEMTRRRMSKGEMAKKLEMREGIFDKKLQNKESFFTINQIVKIKDIFGDEKLTLDYLVTE